MFYEVNNFNPDDYGRFDIMVCDDAEEAEYFRILLHTAGRRWSNGDPYIGINTSNAEARNFIFNSGKYVNNTRLMGIYCEKILKFSDFFSRKQPLDEYAVGNFEDIL